jgi:MFS family permease
MRQPGRERRWIVVAGLFTVTFGVSNPLAAFGVFLPILSDVFGWSRGAIAVAQSLNMVLGGVAGFAVGAIGDRSGPRGVLSVTVVIAGLGFAAGSLVNSLWQFYFCLGLLVGIGASGLYILSTATIARWFDDRRGLALGLVLTGFNLGFMTGGPTAAFLIERVGWRPAYVVLGLAVCAIGGLAGLFVRNPSQAPTAATARDLRDRVRPRLSLRDALVDRRFWLLGGSWFSLGSVFMTLMVHIVPYMRDRGVSLERASLALTAYGLGAMTGRIVFGAVSDRLSAMATMRWCVVIQVGSLVTLLLGPPQWLAAAMLILFGFGFAGADTVVVKAIPDVVGLQSLGAIMGVLGLAWRCGAALGPATAGFIYDATGSYVLPFGAAPILLIASFVLFVYGALPSRAHA